VSLNRFQILGVQRRLFRRPERPEISSALDLSVRPAGRLREQPRHEVRPIHGHLEQRLVDQMEIQLPRRMSTMNAIDGFIAVM
jgi:hypothetical protein